MFVYHSVQTETQPLHNLTEYIQVQWIDSIILLPIGWNVFKQLIQTHNDVAQSSQLLSWWQMQIRVLPDNQTPSLPIPPYFYNHPAYIRQEVKMDPEKKYRQIQQNCPTLGSSTRPAIKMLHDYSASAPTS